jgi:hypothetical protein
LAEIEAMLLSVINILYTHGRKPKTPFLPVFIFIFESNLIAGLGLPGFERSLPPVANVIKLFCHNYIAIGITSVKIMGKYIASGVNYVL